jgi:hypothetical protein
MVSEEINPYLSGLNLELLRKSTNKYRYWNIKRIEKNIKVESNCGVCDARKMIMNSSQGKRIGNYTLRD